MPQRIRVKESSPSVGWKHLTGLPDPETQSISRKRESITDYVEKGDGQPLTIDKVLSEGGLYNWAKGGFYTNGFGNYVPETLVPLTSPQIYGHSTVPGRPTNAALATSLLAKTSPSRPVLDFWSWVAELKDVPRLLRIEGESLLRQAASTNLSLRFGWVPFISDVLTLGRFNREVMNRRNELVEFYKSGLRRRRVLWEGSTSWSSPNHIVQSSGGVLRMDISSTTAHRVWGFVEWKPTTLPPRTEEAMIRLASEACMGLGRDQKYNLLLAAWNIMPWSWLIDWCSNVSDFIQIQRNTVPATHGPVLIMDHRATEGFAPGKSGVTNDRPWSVTDLRFYHETKSRTTASASLSAYLPFLSIGQLSILGSIGVTRRVPRNHL